MVSNIERVGRGLDTLAEALEPFIARVLVPHLPEGVTDWTRLLETKDGGLFVLYALRLLRSSDLRMRALARGTYLYSLLYLALLFVALMLDSTLTGLHIL